MATFYVDIPKIEQEETTKTACLDLDENSNNDVEVGLDATSNNDVKVNIAIAGKAGSGRSSFVNAILGYSMKFSRLCFQRFPCLQRFS